ncbi:MAG: hypothetical protein M1826_004255 [Phylliscum demangeonii]|nr:MAG: hypothetical protein M1826_004255 [Phylliscum demangeonii]
MHLPSVFAAAMIGLNVLHPAWALPQKARTQQEVQPGTQTAPAGGDPNNPDDGSDDPIDGWTMTTLGVSAAAIVGGTWRGLWYFRGAEDCLVDSLDQRDRLISIEAAGEKEWRYQPQHEDIRDEYLDGPKADDSVAHVVKQCEEKGQKVNMKKPGNLRRLQLRHKACLKEECRPGGNAKLTSILILQLAKILTTTVEEMTQCTQTCDRRYFFAGGFEPRTQAKRATVWQKAKAAVARVGRKVDRSPFTREVKSEVQGTVNSVSHFAHRAALTAGHLSHRYGPAFVPAVKSLERGVMKDVAIYERAG